MEFRPCVKSTCGIRATCKDVAELIRTQTSLDPLLRLLQIPGTLDPISHPDNHRVLVAVSGVEGAAQAVAGGRLDMAALREMDDAAVCAALVSLRGVGLWTAEMLLLFSLQRQDVFSFDDLAIQRGLRMLYRHKLIDRARFERYRRRFSPYGSVASLYLWAVAGGALPELSDPAAETRGRGGAEARRRGGKKARPA